MYDGDADALALDEGGFEGIEGIDGLEVGPSSAGAGDGWDEGVPYADETEPDAAALDELTAVAAAEAEALEASRAALDDERARTRTVLERYRELLLAAEPELPAELVHGDTLEELDASLALARTALAGARAALGGGPAIERGFPVGAPARERSPSVGLSASEKIHRGLEERLRER